MSDPTDLVAWLPACLDRAEQRANAAPVDPIGALTAGLMAASADERGHGNTEVADALAWASKYVAENGPPLVLHDPKWRLGDIARKRLILAEHEAVHVKSSSGTSFTFCGECGEPNEYPVDWPCATVRLLAEEFDGEPGYDAQRWRP